MANCQPNFNSAKIMSSRGWLQVVFLAALFLSFGGLFWGFVRIAPTFGFPWASLGSFFSFIGCVTFLTFATELMRRVLKTSLTGGAIVVLIISVAALEKLQSFGAAIFVLMWMYALGHAVRKWISCGFLFEAGKVLLGAGILGTGLIFLVQLPVNNNVFYVIFGCLSIILAFWQKSYSSIQIRMIKNILVSHKRSDPLDYGLIAAFSGLFLFCLSPQNDYDALAYHLLMLGHLKSFGFWSYNPDLYTFSFFSLLADWCFGAAYILGGAEGAIILNLGFVAVLARIVFLIAIKFGTSQIGAKASALLIVSTPLTNLEVSGLHVELLQAAFVVSGTALFLFSDKGKRSLAAAAIFFAFAVSTKITAAAYMIPLVPILMVRTYKHIYRQSKIIKSFFIFTIPASVPYVLAFHIAGNPVFPFYNSLFGSPYFPATNFIDARWQEPLRLDFLYDATFYSQKFIEGTPGVIGFYPMLILPSCLLSVLLLSRLRIFALVLIGGVLSVSVMTTYIRYMYPSLVLCSIFIVAGLSRLSALGVQTYIKPLALGCFALNAVFWTAGVWGPREFKIQHILRPNDYIPDEQKAVALINKINPFKEGVIFTSKPFGAGLSGKAFYLSWHSQSFFDKFKAIRSTNELLELANEMNIRFIVLGNEWEDTPYAKLIKDSSKLISQVGNVQILVLERKADEGELIKNAKLQTLHLWHHHPDLQWSADDNGVPVTEQRHIVQRVKVEEGRIYINTVESKCLDNPSYARVQVNWLSEDLRFISTAIQVSACSPEKMLRSQVIQAPRRAKYADVYGSAADERQILITGISMRPR